MVTVVTCGEGATIGMKAGGGCAVEAKAGDALMVE
jgi:hypothetical protein